MTEPCRHTTVFSQDMHPPILTCCGCGANVTPPERDAIDELVDWQIEQGGAKGLQR